MKNLHLIPTDKPSRLYEDVDCDLRLGYDFIHRQGMLQNQHIYITSDEEIKEGDWCYAILSKQVFKNVNPNLKSEDKKKIILTTDQDLIENGVQAIDDEFLEWFVENPSCEKVEIRKEKLILGEVAGTTYTDFNYKIIIPQEEIIVDKDVKDFSDKFTEGYNRVVPNHLREDKPIDKEKEKSFGDWVQRLRDRLGWNKEFKDDFFGKQEPKQETLEPIVYNIGDNIRIINPTENQPKLFTTHKVDNNFGVVYYYQLDGKEESIGFSYIKKEEPKQETLEEASWKYNPLKKLDGEFIRHAFKEGAKWQQERMYSEEDMKLAYFSAIQSTGEGWNGEYAEGNNPNIEDKFSEEFKEWFEQFKKNGGDK